MPYGPIVMHGNVKSEKEQVALMRIRGEKSNWLEKAGIGVYLQNLYKG